VDKQIMLVQRMNSYTGVMTRVKRATEGLMTQGGLIWMMITVLYLRTQEGRSKAQVQRYVCLSSTLERRNCAAWLQKQLPRCGFACVVIISQVAKSAAARCPVYQRACVRNPLTSTSISVAIDPCDNSCFFNCMACYHKKTVAVSKREQHEALACRGETSTGGGVLHLKDFPCKKDFPSANIVMYM